MAGQGYRIWTPGEVITADNVQDFLQDQTVQVYDSSAARGSALTGYIAEGMISYLKDTNAVEVYNGSAWEEVGADPAIFTTGTAGQFLKSLGTAGVAWDTVPTPGTATPTTAGLLIGRVDGTAVTDRGNLGLGVNAAGSAVVGAFTTGNVAIGYNAYAIGTAAANTAIGINAMPLATNGFVNTAVGIRSNYDLTSGNYNTSIGADSGFDITTGSNNTNLGFDANPSSPTSSNEITLGNNAVTTLRCQVTTITGLSDQRDKKDIVDLPVGLSFIKELRPVKFTWNTRIPESKTLADGTIKEYTEADVRRNVPDIGFIAQDLVEAEDSLNAHDYLQLTLRSNPDKLEASPGRLVPILVKAVQELSAKVEELEARLK